MLRAVYIKSHIILLTILTRVQSKELRSKMTWVLGAIQWSVMAIEVTTLLAVVALTTLSPTPDYAHHDGGAGDTGTVTVTLTRLTED